MTRHVTSRLAVTRSKTVNAVGLLSAADENYFAYAGFHTINREEAKRTLSLQFYLDFFSFYVCH